MADYNDQAKFRRLQENIKQLNKRVDALEQANQQLRSTTPPTARELLAKQLAATKSKLFDLPPSHSKAPDSKSSDSKDSVASDHADYSPSPKPAKFPPRKIDRFQAIQEVLDKSQGKSLESIVGERWLTWLGSGSLILAVAYFVPWAWQHFQLPAWFRVLVFHIAGLGVLASAKYFSQKKLPELARGVAGLGIFILYAAAYTMHHHYHLGGENSEMLAFIDCILITFATIIIALRTNSVAVILLGALGGYLTPLIASIDSTEYVTRFVYLAFLNIALLTCATLRPWQFLKPIAVIATAFMFLGWIHGPNGNTSATTWGTEWLLILHAVIFLVGITFPTVWWRQTSIDRDRLAIGCNSIWFMGATWMLFYQHPNQQLAAVCWALSALHAALFVWTYKCVTNADPMPRLHLALSIIFFTLAIPFQLRDSLQYLAYAWAVEGLVFTAIAVYFYDKQLARAGEVVFALALIRAFAFEFTAAPELLAGTSIDRRFLVVLFAGLTMIAAGTSYWWAKRIAPKRAADPLDNEAGAILIAIGNLVAMISLTCQWESRLVLVLWTLNAALFWAIACYTNNYHARIYALFLSILLVGGRAAFHHDAVTAPFQLLLNDRFGSLLLVAILYFVPAWYLRTRLSPKAPTLTEFEQGVPLLLHVLGNVVLFLAISMEIHDWFRGTGINGKISTSEQVTYSVVWAIYAAVLVAVGFALKYRLPRMMGLVGFLLVALKVFFVDLANQPLIFRVLALAALGGMLLLTSFWYQKFSTRLQSEESKPG